MGYEPTCKICKQTAKYDDLCGECWLGLKCFQRKPKLLGRAIAYLQNSGKLLTRRERRVERRRNNEIRDLRDEQRRDRMK